MRMTILPNARFSTPTQGEFRTPASRNSGLTTIAFITSTERTNPRPWILTHINLAALVKTRLNFKNPRQLQLALSLLVSSILLLTGCQSVSSSHTQEIGRPRYLASNPAQVEILRTPPTRAHVHLGEVRVQPSSQYVDAAKIEDAMRKEAAKLGADAVVVEYDHTHPAGEQIIGYALNRYGHRIVVAVAIKYL